MSILMYVAIALFYVMMVGLSQKASFKFLHKRCMDCKNHSYCTSDHDFTSWLGSILWPISLVAFFVVGLAWVPWKMGSKLGDWAVSE